MPHPNVSQALNGAFLLSLLPSLVTFPLTQTLDPLSIFFFILIFKAERTGKEKHRECGSWNPLTLTSLRTKQRLQGTVWGKTGCGLWPGHMPL